jgi:competence protein ComEA
VQRVNEAMPGWRSFASGPAGDGEDPERHRDHDEHPRDRITRTRILALVLAILGACGIGAAIVLGAVVLLWATPAPVIPGLDGDPLLASTDEDGWTAGGLSGGSDGLAATSDVGGDIVIDVGGAVDRPGLVRLRRGDRVGDAIAAAGGFGPRVDLAAVGRSHNLALAVEDGEKIIVPELGSEVPPAATEDDGLVDLNGADQAALESLPGIGPVTAARIIEARAQQRFRSVDELRSREVVGESVFEDIRDLVRVSG